MDPLEKAELYDIYAKAQLIRDDTGCSGSFTILVQKVAPHVSAHNILEHVFTAVERGVTESEEIYLGRFEKHEEIAICFQNDGVGDDEVNDNWTVPVICLYDKIESEMSLSGDGVRSKVMFTLKPHVKEAPQMTTRTRSAKFVPSSSAYRFVRSFVLAVANVKSRVDSAAQALVGTVSFAVEGTKFVCTMSYDLTRDFLVSLDILFSEGCLAVDEGIDSTRTLLADSLGNLSQQLHLRLMTADHILTQKIVTILQRLHPYINSVTRMAYPYVSLALFLSKPLRTVLYPYVEPTINRALGLHDRLQKSMIVGPMVASATEKALIVYQSTANIYQALEDENKNKWD